MEDASATRSVNLTQYIDETPWTTAQKMMIVMMALAFIIDGCANQVLGLAIPSIVAEWHVQRAATAPIAAIGLLGIAFGAMGGGIVADRIGRRKSLIAAITLFGIATLLSASTNSVASLAAVRFFDGLGLGGALPICTALLAETSPRNRRAIAIAAGMLFIPAGGVISGLLSTVIVPTFGWRGLFVGAGLLALASAVFFAIAIPESPFYLALRPERKDELGRVMRRLKTNVDPNIVFYDVIPPREERKISTLLNSEYRTITIGVWVGFFCCLLASYTLFSWLPSLLSARGFTHARTGFVMSLFHSGSIVGGLISGILFQRYGVRKPLLGIAAAALIIAIVLSVCSIDPDHSVVLTIIFMALGLLLAAMHNGFYTLTAFVYPSAIRGSGIGAASGLGRLGAITSSFTGVFSMGLSAESNTYFLVIAAWLFIGLIGVSVIRAPKTLVPAASSA
ncbi:MFS transporter [Paraburkholderia sprentiae WSM5005]|uniref:MFS transporter n=1 Tax=Paraburkholderia sprentiae WSM5005 TaxID=754502 RepID=A0A1I9YFI7_9BURK|nr:MFS transporter [Paraburkholderia sprentiae]APA85070.2 MFS transporter [Paraburkholderia sprentiae WSM5005]